MAISGNWKKNCGLQSTPIGDKPGAEKHALSLSKTNEDYTLTKPWVYVSVLRDHICTSDLSHGVDNDCIFMRTLSGGHSFHHEILLVVVK